MQVVVVEDGEQDETSEVARPESAPPPLSPQVHTYDHLSHQFISPIHLIYWSRLSKLLFNLGTN